LDEDFSPRKNANFATAPEAWCSIRRMKTFRLSLLACTALLPLVPLSAEPDAAKGPNVEARVAKMKEKLSLTDDQASSIKAILEDQKTKIEAVRADDSLPKEQKKEKVKAIMTETRTKVDAVLTPEQKAKADEARKKREEKKDQ
jgi:Spy/CpxP family protein refolding chaperone